MAFPEQRMRARVEATYTGPSSPEWRLEDYVNAVCGQLDQERSQHEALRAVLGELYSPLTKLLPLIAPPTDVEPGDPQGRRAHVADELERLVRLLREPPVPRKDPIL